MRRRTFVLAVLVAALAGPSAALANTTPEFDVIPFPSKPGKVVDTELDLFFPPTASTPAQIKIGVPAGYGVAPTALGSSVANAFVDVVVAGQTKHVKGNVVADDPARYTADACAPGTHAAVWVVYLTVSSQPYVIPLFVDPATGADALNDAYTIQACFLTPDVPVGGAPAGARITEFDLDFSSVFRNPTAEDYYKWSVLVTPFAAGTTTPETAALYELRSVATIPELLTIKASYDKKQRVSVISGRLTAIGKPEKGIEIHIYGANGLFENFKRLANVRTDAQGNYVLRRRFTHAMFVAPYVPIYVGPCDRPPSLAPGGCPLQTWSPVAGPIVKATVPTKRH